MAALLSSGHAGGGATGSNQPQPRRDARAAWRKTPPAAPATPAAARETNLPQDPARRGRGLSPEQEATT